ncbi:hypothetical protein [Kineococcus auxinigenes]|uniref:hypothetical protein n=1 Tax=unclassified Kineococcus TaxID=2621656 RepID=UPI003D7D2BFB
MSTTSTDRATSTSTGLRPRDLGGVAVGAALFAALTWLSAHWLTTPTTTAGTIYVLAISAVLAAGVGVAVLAARAGLAAGVTALLLVLIGRLLGGPADVGLSMDGLQLPQVVIRSGAHQPVVVAAAVTVLIVALLSLRKDRSSR